MRILMLCAALSALATTPAFAQLESPLSPLLEVVRLPRELLAIDSDGGGDTPVRLEVGERVLWTGSQGRVGAAITDRRMLMVATRSGAWQEVRFERGELIPEAAELGDRIVLFSTDERVVGFDSGNRIARVVSIGSQEDWAGTAVSANVALVLTTRRALALGVGVGGFFETRLRVGEAIDHMAAYAKHATVSTPARLLIFRTPTGSWAERRLRLK